MWIRTAKYNFNLDKVEFTELLPNGSMRLVFANGTITLDKKEALEVITYLDNISTPAFGLVDGILDKMQDLDNF